MLFVARRVVVTVTDEDILWDVDALSVEGVVSGVTVGRGVLTIFMLGAPDGDGAHPTVCFEFPMSVVRDFSVGERPMLRHVEWREDGGFAYALRFTGGCGEIGADEAAARVREYGGSCWGLDKAVECERALNERFPLTGGRRWRAFCCLLWRRCASLSRECRSVALFVRCVVWGGWARL